MENHLNVKFDYNQELIFLNLYREIPIFFYIKEFTLINYVINLILLN